MRAAEMEVPTRCSCADRPQYHCCCAAQIAALSAPFGSRRPSAPPAHSGFACKPPSAKSCWPSSPCLSQTPPPRPPRLPPQSSPLLTSMLRGEHIGTASAQWLLLSGNGGPPRNIFGSKIPRSIFGPRMPEEAWSWSWRARWAPLTGAGEHKPLGMLFPQSSSTPPPEYQPRN